MKTFLQNFSITKLVFLIVMICLCVFTGYQYWIGQEITIKLRETVVTACISFYFWQKSMQYPEPDSLVKRDKETNNEAIEAKSDPLTLIELLVFVFWLWATWSSLNWRIKELERKTDEIDWIKIETKLAEIQRDLQWIKEELNKSSRK